MFAVLALVPPLGVASAVISSSRPASADQLADAKAQAAAITAKIQATQAQIAVADRPGAGGRLPAVPAERPDRGQPGPGGQGPGQGEQGRGPAPHPGHQRLHEQRHHQPGHPDVLVEREHVRHPLGVLLDRHRQCDHHDRQPAHGPSQLQADPEPPSSSSRPRPPPPATTCRRRRPRPRRWPPRTSPR